MEKIVSTPSQGAAGGIHSPSTYKSQLFQMFTDMKEKMEKHQALFDREREQAMHDRENAVCEREELKRQNNQLLS